MPKAGENDPAPGVSVPLRESSVEGVAFRPERRFASDVPGSRYLHDVAPTAHLPGPCALCGGLPAVRTAGAWHCALCGWRYGDSPDPDLPFPRIDVVYYLRYDKRVKIGTSRQPRRRLARIRHDELLAFEHGDRVREQQRHRQFASAREGGEWFTLTPEIRAHIAALQRHGDPWHQYARWLSAALRE